MKQRKEQWATLNRRIEELDEIRAALRRRGVNFNVLFDVGIGVGKTTQVAKNIGSLLQNEGDCVIICCDQHKLSDQTANDIRAHLPNARVEVLRGPNSIPEGGSSGDVVCAEFENYKYAEARKLSFCDECPVAKDCAAIKAKDVVADVYLISHARLIQEASFMGKGDRKKQNLVAIIIDESPISAAIATEVSELCPQALNNSLLPEREGDSIFDQADWEALSYQRRKLAEVFNQAAEPREASWFARSRKIDPGKGPVPLTLGLLRKVGLEEKITVDAWRKAEWKRKVDDLEDENVDSNLTLGPISNFLKAAAELFDEDAPEKSGRAYIMDRRDREGKTHRVGVVNMFHPIPENLSHVPVIMLDATPRTDLLKQWLRGAKMRVYRARAVNPHGKIVQDTLQNGAKTRFADETKQGLRARLHGFYKAETGMGQTLLVCQQAVEALMASEEVGMPPEDLAHFNAVRGRNDWADYARQISIGGPRPRVSDVIMMGGALSGRHVETIAPEVIEDERLVWHAGRIYAAPTERKGFTDKVLDELYQLILADEVEQSERLRLINATAESPKQWTIFSDAVIRSPVHLKNTLWESRPDRMGLELAEKGWAWATHKPTDLPPHLNVIPAQVKSNWTKGFIVTRGNTLPEGYAELKPSPIEIMLERLGFIVLSGRHAMAAMPGVWASERTAKREVAKIDPADIPYGFERVEYRFAVSGSRDCTAYVPEGMSGDVVVKALIKQGVSA